MRTIDPLRALLSPRSIVIVGASADPNKVNGRPIRNLLRDGFRGRVYLVNPKYPDISGIPCYPDIAALPEAPELGVVGVAAEGAKDVVAALGAKGVKMAIVWSSGFGESGPNGKRLEEELMDTARQYGVRICGPNTLGLTNAFEDMPLTFSQYADTPLESGPVAFVSQSGAFGTAVATAARNRGIGLGYFVSTGNQADITIATVINTILDDKRISVVVAYMEGLSDGRDFLFAAEKAIALGKPLIVVKVGKLAAGRRAAVSHTGSLAVDDAVFDSVIRQHGVLRAHNESHALDLTSALVACPIPQEGGVGLITISGGAGAMMADLAEELGMEVPVLAPETQARLSGVLRGFASTGNPVDVTGQVLEDVGVLSKSLNFVLDDPQIAVCVIWIQLLHGKAEQLADQLIACRRAAKKPFILCWLNSPSATVRRLREAGICVTDSTLGGIQAAVGLVEHGRARRRCAIRKSMPGVTPQILRQTEGSVETVPSIEAAQMLARSGLMLAPARLATTEEEALSCAAELGFPVALKIESPDLPHKTEANGVRLNLTNADQVRLAFPKIIASGRAYKPDARITGVLVQAIEASTTELVLGLRRDPVFGPIVMVGLGGIFVEALKDVVFASPPFSKVDAEYMISRLRCQSVLRGIRGKPAVNLDMLAQAMCSLSNLAQSYPEITELDLNPVFGGPDRVVAVDWLMLKDTNG